MIIFGLLEKLDLVDLILKCFISEVMMKFQKSLIPMMKDGLKFGMMSLWNLIKKVMVALKVFLRKMLILEWDLKGLLPYSKA